MSATPERDVAVALLSRLVQKLFERTWLPFTPAVERACGRIVDAIINAAAEQARAHDDTSAFDAELDSYAAYTGETLRSVRRTRPLDNEEAECRTEDELRGLRDFRAWQARRQQEG